MCVKCGSLETQDAREPRHALIHHVAVEGNSGSEGARGARGRGAASRWTHCFFLFGFENRPVSARRKERASGRALRARPAQGHGRDGRRAAGREGWPPLAPVGRRRVLTALREAWRAEGGRSRAARHRHDPAPLIPGSAGRRVLRDRGSDFFLPAAGAFLPASGA